MNKLLSIILPFINTKIGAVVALGIIVWTLSHHHVIFGVLAGIGYVALLCL